MTPPANSSDPLSRLGDATDAAIVAGLALLFSWTTLCLGGAMAKTMVVTGPMVFGLATLAGLRWLTGRRAPDLHRAVLLPLPFLILCLVSVLWLAPARWLAWREWLLWLQMALVFGLVLHFGRGRRATGVMVATFVLLGLAGTAMAFYQRFANPTWMMLGREQADQFIGRSAGMFGQPNSLAALLELMVPVGLALAFSPASRPLVRLAGGALAVIFIPAIVLTGSRGGWIALGLALLLGQFLRVGDWRRRLTGAAVLLGLAVVGLGLLYRFSAYAHERIQPFLEGKFEASRPILWRAAVQIWRDHPWLGSGANSFNLEFEPLRPAGFLNEPVWAHNDYLNTLSDFGLIGFLLWAGAGAGLMLLAWRACHRVGEEETFPGVDAVAWKRGLFLGLFAFVTHLWVDFHTKLPATAFAFAIAAGLLLRDDAALRWQLPRSAARLVGAILLIGLPLLAWKLALPLYRAEALRFDARKSIDRHALTGKGDLKEIVPVAKAALLRAVQIDPENGQAWSDLSYVTVQEWHARGGSLIDLGRRAELAADEALKRCQIQPEFWVRKGVALDMQRGRPEVEDCYRRALALAPKNQVWWYYYAYHLSTIPARKSDARLAVETCLTLDPYYPGAEALRHNLGAGH